MPDILPRDERSWEECHNEVKRYCWGRGVRPGDVVQVLHGFECIRWGYEQIGATTLLIHAGRGILDNQIRLAKAMNVTVIEHVPILAIQYLERARELGIDMSGLKVVLTGEGFSEAYKKKLEAKYGITFLQEVWAATELRTTAIECEEHNGFHILEDHIVEVIDPETQQVLDVGQEGELVATSLVIDSTPMIRWRSADIGSLLPYEPCPCGRTLPKISSPIRGRIAFSVKVKEKRIFPIDIEEVVASVPGLAYEYQIIADKPGELEKLKVKAEVNPEVKDVAALKEKAQAALNRELGVESEVELVPLGALEHALFKAQRLITTYQKS
jgi:phenylacetate-CoA ligase